MSSCLEENLTFCGHKIGLRLRRPTALPYSATSQPTDHTFNFLTPTVGRWQRHTEEGDAVGLHGRPRLLKPGGTGVDRQARKATPVVHMRRSDPDEM